MKIKYMKNLELYVHIPFCVKKCAYCDFLSFSADEQTQREYVDALIREIYFYGSVFRLDSANLCESETMSAQNYAVSTVFIGGGTPSWLDTEQMLRILDALYRNFYILPDAEISMECNPGTMTRAKLKQYKKAGVNRLSIGLQSADNEELRLLGRIHTFEQFLKTYELAREVGFENINVDLISGIPYQTAEKFLHTLQKVIYLKPNHISAYSLIVEPGTPFYEVYQEDMERQEEGKQTKILPTEDEICRIIALTKDVLQKNGYEQYEISNFAQPGFACKHNIGYWTRENYLGLGLGAASLIENVRYSNVSDLPAYMKKTENIKLLTDFSKKSQHILKTNLHASVELIPRYAQMEEFMFLGLRMKQGISRNKFQENFGVAIEAVYQNILLRLKEDGLLVAKEGRIALTEKGEDVSNYVLAQFLLNNEMK